MIVGIEINHKHAPVALRERLSFSEEQIPETLDLLLNGRDGSPYKVLESVCTLRDCAACHRSQFLEAAILSTCNRAGIYGLGGCPELLARFLVCSRGLKLEELRSSLIVYENQSAVEHLFTIAAGLDSQVLGEPQILGQVRGAYELARRAGAAGPILSELFRRALHTGKRTRAETELARHPASLASVALELVSRVCPALKSALLVGSGEMGELVATLLRKRGIHQLLVVSRTGERASALARKLEAQPLAVERLGEALVHVDLVISATDAHNGYVMTAPQVAAALRHRDRPLLLIDLGLPRNLDPQIRRLAMAALHDLDDLKAVSDAGLGQRRQEIPKAQRIVAEETENFMRWFREQRATPIIRALHHHAEALRQEQLNWALPKLGSLNPQQQRIIETLTTRLVNKLLHTPTQQLKTLAQQAESCEPFTLFKQLFLLQTAHEDQREPSPTRPHRRAIIIGTRGSALAQAQTEQILGQLRKLHPHIEFLTQVIKTTGDQGQTLTMGAFVKELEEALQRGEIDLAVHSLKDMPTELPGGLIIAAVSKRADPRDVLLSRDKLPLAKLPRGARVGTSSPRRIAQLLALRSDLVILPLQGNVDTRLKKLAAGEADALVLAAAGLERLGLLDRVTEFLSLEQFLPAAGQGALAIEARAEDLSVLNLLKSLEHPETRAAITAERTFLQALGGGCRVPIAAYGCITEGQLVLDGLVASPDGQRLLRDRLAGPPEVAETVGRELAERLLAAGAAQLLEHL
jgi:hydroxymethylbilane synthase